MHIPHPLGPEIGDAMRLIDSAELQSLLPMQVAIDALEAAFGAPELPETPSRSHLSVGGGDLLMMPAAGDYGAGVKLVTVNSSNPGRGLPLIHGAYALFAPETLELVGVIEGSGLTGLRTAAVSGLATRYMAREGASRLVLFGAGVQAHTHLDAMCAVRAVEEVWVVSRTRGRAEALAERARSAGLRSHVGEPDDVAAADVVCTCTSSPVPVFDGSQLPDGAHINAVGAFTPQTRELDDDVARRARFAVELRAAAMAEAGDILIPLQSGVIDSSSVVAELSEIVGGMPVRRTAGDVTVFKSVGVAFEDLVLGRAAFDAAIA